jgi:CO/xanthine dehydrogenase Mo-binding subunit
MLYVKVLRSPVHKGVIRKLDVSTAENMPGVAGVITAKDIPGTNAYGLVPDQPVFTPENIRYKGERIAAVAAVDEDTAMEAVEKMKLDIEEQTPVFDPVEAMEPGAPQVTPEGNLAEFNSGKSRIVRFGDVERDTHLQPGFVLSFGHVERHFRHAHEQDPLHRRHNRRRLRWEK